MKLICENEAVIQSYGARLGEAMSGGELIELIGDVGAGKTTMTRGLARGMGIGGAIQSPTFTISNQYNAPSGLRLSHYDFYRLDDAGIMSDELYEAVHDMTTVVVIEWGDVVADVLPDDRLTITIVPTSETARELMIEPHGPRSIALMEKLI